LGLKAINCSKRYDLLLNVLGQPGAGRDGEDHAARQLFVRQ
jgi:hypothetical protein